jgi:hypothetical protein
MQRFLIAAILLAMAAPAAADKGGAVVRDLGDGARVDWTRGLLLARGAAAGDLRAPSASVARLAAERRARAAARARLRKLAADLPLADGRKLGAALDGDAKARFDRALEHTIDEAIDHGTDGSVVLTCALPLEAVRAAVGGAAAPAALAVEGAPTALLVEADRQLKRPLLGIALAAGGERYAGPTVYAARGGAVAGNTARLGARPRPLRAGKLGKDGTLEITGESAAAVIAQARAAGALVMIIIKESP